MTRFSVLYRKKYQWLKRLLVICFMVVGVGCWQLPALAHPHEYSGYYEYSNHTDIADQQQYDDNNILRARTRALSPPDIQRILDRDKLIVAVLTSDNAPFFMTDDSDSNNLIGLDAKIAKGLADALGVEVEFNRSADTFNGVVDQVYQLKADIAISKISQPLSRAQNRAIQGVL